jgi:hypothetical protein
LIKGELELPKAIEVISVLEIEDFDEFIIMAIGANRYLHEHIEKLYETNREQYYELYKNSKYFKNEKFMTYTALNYEYIQKFAGIFLYEKSADDSTITMDLIKKGYKIVYNFIKDQKAINMIDLRDHFLKTVEDKGYGTTVKSSHVFTIAIYLCTEFNVDIDYDKEDLIKIVKGSFDQYSVYYKFKKKELNDAEIKEYLNKYNDVGINKNGFKLTLNNMLAAIFRQIAAQLAQEDADFEKLDNEQQDKLLLNNTFIKTLDIVNAVLYFCNMDAIDLQSITVLDYNKIRQIAGLCLDSAEKNELPQSSIDMLFALYLILYSLAEEYNVTKNEYLNSAHEETILEVKKLKEKYKSELSSLKDNEETRNREVTRLTNLCDELKKETVVLNKAKADKENEITKLTNQLENLEKEANELRHILDMYRNEYYDEEQVTISKMLEYINTKKCAIIGGHETWQEKLKNKLPNIRFLSADEINKDLSFLANMDAILFNESKNSHSMYNKVKSFAEGSNIPLLMVGKVDNLELSIENIYRELKHCLD